MSVAPLYMYNEHGVCQSNVCQVGVVITKLHMSMLNAVIISGMTIVSFIIKHTHFFGRNVMLRSVSDRID